MNSLFQQLQRQQPQKLSTQQPKNNLFQQFLSSSNPEQFIQKMMMNNPKMQNVMQAFKMSKMTPKQFFYQYAQSMGVDPNQFLNSIKED